MSERHDPTPALPRGLVFASLADDVVLVQRAADRVGLWLRHDGVVDSFDCATAGIRAWAEEEGGALADHVQRLLALQRPRQFAGISLDRPVLMGIVNVTPNSFSDGGLYLAAEAAIAHGRALQAMGADIIDVGGESTRPGAEPVTPEQEADRVLPVVAALAAEGLVVSIDSRHAAVMEQAVAAGARIINDVTALTYDPDAVAVAAASGASVVLMHMQGEPRTMQVAPHYDYAPLDVHNWLRQRLLACANAGIATERLCVDPGIGFGKSVAHNCQIIADLDLFHALGVPLMLGLSRKSFIAALSQGEPALQRLPGSLAANLAGLQRGVQILRVHDVAETAQAVAVWHAVNHGHDLKA